MLSLDEIHDLTGRRLGVFDVACPSCGPDRRQQANRSRKVLRVWSLEYGFAGFACARCGISGHARENGPDVSRPDPAALAKARAEAAERKRAADADGRGKALHLYRQRRPHKGTIVETYLREARKCRGYIPETIGYLPARGEHLPAMITPFALADEPEPGLLLVDGEAPIQGIHLTRLRPDGGGKAGEPSKIMLGPSLGTPLVLAPFNDLLGLAICEGIEDGLSLAEANGFGVWAAGSASRLPALGDTVPSYVDCVTVVADPDIDGQRHARNLHQRLVERGLTARFVTLAAQRLAA